MFVKTVVATVFIALSASGAYAQGETVATEEQIRLDNNDDVSRRLPTAGTGDVGAVFDNIDGSQGSSGTSSDLNPAQPQIAEDNAEDPIQRAQ